MAGLTRARNFLLLLRLHRQLDGYLDAGLTKFVIRPVGGASLDGFIDRFVAELTGRQN